MEIKLNILGVFFENPEKKFHIREVARKLKINHTTIRNYFNKFIKQNLIQSSGKGIYKTYTVIKNKQFLNLKLFYNLEKIRHSKIIDFFNNEFDYPEIILFGSYSIAYDDINSDIDFCIISNIKKNPSLDKFTKQLNRNVSLHLFSEKKWKLLIKNNPELANNICKGIVLSENFEAFR